MLLTGLLTLAVGACSDDADGTRVGSSVPSSRATTTSSPIDGVPIARSAALSEPSDGTYEVSWDELVGAPYYAYDDVRDPDDPFWHVHTNAGTDGFFLSLEMFTAGFGAAWAGETGTFPIDCAGDGTGICLHFNPDGPLAAGDLGADFAVTGEVEIEELDEDGYALVLSDVTFSNGATIPGPTVLSG